MTNVKLVQNWRQNRFILVSSRALSFTDAFGPPVEQRRGANEVGTSLQGDTACRLRVFQVLDAGKVRIDQDRVGQWPEMFGRLELGRIGGQEQQVDVLRHPQPQTGVPASTVEDEHDLF